MISTRNFTGYENLRLLYLDFNRAGTLEDGAFVDLRLLDVLSLEGNPLKTINPGAFVGLSLREAWLQRCLLVWIGPETFAGGLSHLKLLNLSGNHLSFIPKGTFDALVYLKYLDMSGNKIEVITSGIFRNSGILREIILRSNFFSEVPRGIASNKAQLRKFDVSDNSLDSPLQLEFSSPNINLLAQNCTLGTIPNVSFTAGAGLIRMSLKDNNLTHDCTYDDVVVVTFTEDGARYTDESTNRILTDACIGQDTNDDVTSYPTDGTEGRIITMETPKARRKDHERSDSEANMEQNERGDTSYIVVVAVLSLVLVVSIGIHVRTYLSNKKTDQNNPRTDAVWLLESA